MIWYLWLLVGVLIGFTATLSTSIVIIRWWTHPQAFNPGDYIEVGPPDDYHT